MRKRIILLIALLTVVLAFASCKNKTKYTVSVKLAEGEQLIGSITTEVGKKALIGDVINETSVQKEGHISHIAKLALKMGFSWPEVSRMASLNTCAYYGLSNRGNVRSGYVADIVVTDDDCATISLVIKGNK